ncbi:restriction endonuclease subunit S [Nocardioides ferulae]|uniref:restriction endonuclease subunit S n=1 Tax=Nocardioides ferulae TaxID=2340821 RepID=UPI00197F76B9|nr:restriction endonuclease subunit S [Nocardioides ferulae]
MIVGDLVDQGFAEIKTGPFGTQLRASDYAESGRPVLNVRNVGFGDVRPKDFEYVDEATASRLSSHLLRPRDIVFGRKGAVERHAYITEKYDGAMQGSDCIRLRIAADSPIPAEFITFALRTKQHQAWMQSFCSHGATMASLNQNIVRQIPLPDLDKAQQELAIAVLQNIDDLIENNRRRVEVLEEMARTIYREWFVKFRYPGHENVLLVDSVRGRIPQGWEQVKLYDAAEVGFGFSFKSPRFTTQGPHQVIRIRDIPVGISTTFTDESADTRYAVHDDDVLIGMDGDFHMTVWTGEDAWLNQRVTRLRPRLAMSPLHLLLAIESQIIEWNRAIVGTTVAHLGKKHLELVTVLVPDGATLERATELFGSFMDQRRCLEQSNRRLASLRDLLLPRLVTGQIDVSSLDLETLVAGRVA